MNEARMPLDDIRIESVDVDIAIQGQYVNYSAEILRLSVLAIGAVGYLITTKPNLSKWPLVEKSEELPLFSAGFLLVGAAFFVYWLALAVLR